MTRGIILHLCGLGAAVLAAPNRSIARGVGSGSEGASGPLALAVVDDTNATNVNWIDVAKAAADAVSTLKNYTQERELKPAARVVVWVASFVMWLREFRRPAYVLNDSNETVTFHTYSRWLRTPWTPARRRVEPGAEGVVRSIGWGPMTVVRDNAGRGHRLERGHRYSFDGSAFRERMPPTVTRRNFGLLFLMIGLAAVAAVLGPARALALVGLLVEVGKRLVDLVTNPKRTTEKATAAPPTSSLAPAARPAPSPPSSPRTRIRGTVTWFSDQCKYGYLRPDDPSRPDVYVHSAAAPGGSLNAEDRCEFRVATYNGRQRAVDVVLLWAAPRPPTHAFSGPAPVPGPWAPALVPGAGLGGPSWSLSSESEAADA